jgi:hypothetical protein
VGSSLLVIERSSLIPEVRALVDSRPLIPFLVEDPPQVLIQETPGVEETRSTESSPETSLEESQVPLLREEVSVEPEERAQALALASVPQIEAEPEVQEEPTGPSWDPSMKKADLLAIALAKGLTLSPTASKTDILNALKSSTE